MDEPLKDDALYIDGDLARRLVENIHAFRDGDPGSDEEWEAMYDRLDAIKNDLTTLLTENGLL
jgi:hypothetical protein